MMIHRDEDIAFISVGPFVLGYDSQPMGDRHWEFGVDIDLPLEAITFRFFTSYFRIRLFR